MSAKKRKLEVPIAQRISAYIKRRDANAEMWNNPQTWEIGAKFLCPLTGEHTLIEKGVDYCATIWYDKYGNKQCGRFDNTIQRVVVILDWVLLGLSDARILDNARKSRKTCDKMTSRMGRNLRNACYLLEHQYGKDCLSFLTLTLPSVSEHTLGIWCDNWDTIVNKFFKWLSQKIAAKGETMQYVYCTEIQLKRLQNRGEYAPHLHAVFNGRAGKKNAWYVTPAQIKKAWIRILKHYTTDTFTDTAIENIQRIKYSAARYLSKYLSKGTNQNPRTDAERHQNSLHTHWGGMSRSLSKRIRQLICRVDSSLPQGFIAVPLFLSMGRMLEHGVISFWRKTYIQFRGNAHGGKSGIFVGCGKLSIPTYEGGLIATIPYLDDPQFFVDCEDLLQILDKSYLTSSRLSHLVTWHLLNARNAQ